MTQPLLVELDYSQIELRVLASISRDERLIATFLSPEADPHTDTAKVVFGVPQPTSEQRRIAKIVNFSIAYDVQPQGLWAQIESHNPGVWTLAQCAEMIAAHNNEHPGVVQYKTACRLEARKYGYVTGLWGERLYVPEIYSRREYIRAEAERKAINFKIQRGAQTIIRRAMGVIYAYLRAGYLLESYRPVLQIHDSLLFETDPETHKEVTPVVKCLMETATQLESGIPILVAVKAGRSLGEMEEMK